MAKIMDTTGTDRMIVGGKKNKKMVFLLVGLGILVTGSILLTPTLRNWFRADRSFERARLRYATVERGALVRDLSVEGRIVASSYPTLYSPARGTVTLLVKAGDRVDGDQVVARVDSPELFNALQQEISQIAAMEADHSGRKIRARTTNLRNKQDVDLKKLRQDTARRELVRMKRSFEEGLTSRMDYDKALDDLAIAELEYRHAAENAELQRETQNMEVRNRARQLERQQLVLNEAQRRVAELEIRSPVSGIVGSVAIDPKDIVSRNQVLLTVIDLSGFEITISIPENYADEVVAGTVAEINYEGEAFRGRVTSVSPEVENSLVEGRMAFDGPLPKGLKQNQRVSTRMILSSLDDVLRVRRGPFLESGGGRKVYVVEDGMALLRTVSMGASSLSEVEVRNGLREGDVIVISDTTRFQNAQTVMLRD